MDDSWDEYDAYDLSEFSATDFMHIDATAGEHNHSATAPEVVTCSAQGHVGTSRSGGPQIVVALEPTADESVVVKAAVGTSRSGDTICAAQNADKRGNSEPTNLHHAHNLDTRSPFEMHRLDGTLSVSNLVGPAWCEVQYDYGLRQGRSLALTNRPDAFVSAHGKVITTEKSVAEANEKTLGRGRLVHKELERELGSEEVVIEIHTKEEHWAARFLNMLSGLYGLMKQGRCREMPVFGIVQDQAIIGVIDEVLLKSILEPELPARPIVQELFLLDTKTRRSNLFPSDDDAFSSRMQLMLYHHLLSALLSPTFSFNTFWEKIQVDPSVEFSDEFLLQAGLARKTDGKVIQGYPACLDDLADLWRLTVRSLQVRGVSRTLEIEYRTQPKRGATLGVSRPSTLDDFAIANQEARELARAIAASLREHQRDLDLERAIANSLQDMAPALGGPVALADTGEGVADITSLRPTEGPSDWPDVPWYSRGSTMEHTHSGVMERARPVGESNIDELGPPGLPTPTLPRLESPRIIGRKSFVFDEEAMNAYVKDVLQWWRGERPPQGVDVEHSYRCFSCEYKEDCEWREIKAKEAHEKYIKGKTKDTGSGPN
ncbi:exonuclease V [Lactifluus subvellereus]|nr:exonuclease V [Lactifluus subvellereus]